MEFIDVVKTAVLYAQKGDGILTCRDLINFCEAKSVEIKKSLVESGLKVFVDGVSQSKGVAALDIKKGSSISYKKCDKGEYVLLRSHIDAIVDTVETKGHLEVYVGDELVVDVKE